MVPAVFDEGHMLQPLTEKKQNEHTGAQGGIAFTEEEAGSRRRERESAPWIGTAASCH